MKTFKENKGKFGCSAIRKLFAEDVEEPTMVFDTDCGVNLDQPPLCDSKLAKLSYIDSNEPEDACQANALEFVDRLIQIDLAGLEQEIHDGKSAGGKSNPVPFAKGPQRLAMKAGHKRMVGETRIYEFDEGLEDEGGGDILRRRKEDFFGVGGDSGEVSRNLAKPRKPRYAGLKGSIVVDMPSNIHGKIKGFVHPVVRSGLHSAKKDKPVRAAERNITKNLISELDEELEPKSFVGELNAADHKVEMLDSEASDKQGTQNICEGSVGDPLKRKLKELNSKEYCLRKRAQPSDALLSHARKSKKMKRAGSNLNENLSISPLKGCKKASILYQYDSEFVKSSRKRVNAEKSTVSMESENTDEIDVIAGSEFSARQFLGKKGCLQEEISTYTPIAHRTRHCSILTHCIGYDPISREENGDPMEAGFVNGKGKSKRGGTAITAANTKSKSADSYSNKPKNLRNNLSSDQCRDLQSVEKKCSKQLHPKLTDMANFSAAHPLGHLRGKTCQISSAMKGTHGICACYHPLLKGRRVLITPNTKPGKEIIANLVKAVQGRAIERIGRSLLKDDKIPDDLLILSCEDDYAICVPFIERGATVYSSELLLNGVVTQKLDYARHCLFEDRVRRTRFTTWLRKDSNQFVAVAKKK